MISISPASLADLAEAQQHYHPRTYRALVYQLTRSPSLTLRDEASGRIVAICGLYPDGGQGDAWLHIVPGIAGTPAAAGLIRALVRIVRDLPRSVRVVAHVRSGHEPGRRLTDLLGMVDEGEVYDGRARRFARRQNP